jgi:hypothetical protein
MNDRGYFRPDSRIFPIISPLTAAIFPRFSAAFKGLPEDLGRASMDVAAFAQQKRTAAATDEQMG